MEQKVKKSTIPTNFPCNICNKFYASHSSLCHHNKKFHKIESNTNVMIPVMDVTIPVTNVMISDNRNLLEKSLINKNICEYCNKVFATRQSKSEHKIKSCKFNPNNPNNNINHNTNNDELFRNEFNELKNTVNLLVNSNKIHPKTLQKINTQNNINNNINNINNNINNIQNNNINNNINVTIAPFGNENLSKILSDKEMKTILSHLRLSVEESIKMVHFNDNRPQYKNIFITNMRDNVAHIFNGIKFEVKSKDYVVSDLLNNHLGNIESFIEDNNIVETFNNRHLFKFFREINGDDINKDNPNYKNYKLNNIKQLIYNHSDKLLLKNLNKLELQEYHIDNDSDSDDNQLD